MTQENESVTEHTVEALFTVETDEFLGPIDLLLHLVKRNELQIEKISLALVADQYVACLERMRNFDLEIAGEYLLIAATLLSVKSSMLLEEPVELELDVDGNLIDPHEELLLRLKEAAIYTEGAAMLGERPILGREVFAPPSSLSDYPIPPETYREHDPYLLGLAFKKLLEKTGNDDLRYEVSLDSVSIVDQMMRVLELLTASEEPVEFELLVRRTSGESGFNRAYVVGTFIALLELCKRQVLQVTQEEENIRVALKSSTGKSAKELSEEVFTSEFDDPTGGEFDEPVGEGAVNE